MTELAVALLCGVGGGGVMSWRAYRPTMHDLSLVDEQYRDIVRILLYHEDRLSDGFGYYAPSWRSDEEAFNADMERHNGDTVLVELVQIAREIVEAMGQT